MMTRATALSLLTAATFAAAQIQTAPPLPYQKAWRGKQTQANLDPKLTFKPYIKGNSIICGNKQLDMANHGVITVSADGQLLARLYTYYAIQKTGSEYIDWDSFSKDLSTVTRIDNGFKWELWKETKDAKWKGADQTILLNQDGTLTVSLTQHQPSTKEWTLRQQRGSFWAILPFHTAQNATVNYNGKKVTLKTTAKCLVNDWQAKAFTYQLYDQNPAQAFTISTNKNTVDSTSLVPYPTNKDFRLTWNLDKRKGSFILDLRNSPPPSKNPDLRGGVDFLAIENIHLPDAGQKNLFTNPSFEAGIHGFRTKHANRTGEWDWKPFQIDQTQAFHGRKSLVLEARNIPDVDYRRLEYGVNVTTAATILSPGWYTASLHAKCEPGKNSQVQVWVPNYHSGSLYAAFNPDSIGRFDLTPNWKQYHVTFEVKRAMPVEWHINAWTRGKQGGKVWIDALQLEAGRNPSPFQTKPAEGELTTSSPVNFVKAEKNIDGALVVTTDHPQTRGKVTVQVKNFFGEKLLNKTIPFQTDHSAVARITLPLDQLPGLGVFVLRADYQLDDGRTAYEFHRYAKVKTLNNTHTLKRIFSADYGSPEDQFTFHNYMQRWKETGIGMKAHHHHFNKKVWDAEKKYGFISSHSFMMSWLRDENRKLVGFGILNDEQTHWSVLPSDPRLLVRDFHMDAGGTLTPQYLEKFKQAAKTIAAKYPHIPMWCLAGEFLAKFTPDWWSKKGTPEECARIHAKLLKAFAEGIKEGNPGVKVFQDDPCNMRPEGGIAETERLLKECNKIGVKFDVIAIHPYRQSPESPDLDSDAQVLFSMLDRVGYGKVPVMWPEMMHWGPFNIPQWGTNSSTWGGPPRTWPGAIMTYDMGWTEKKSAAWYARAWLVALKYADRIITATAGNTHNNFAMDLRLTPYAAQLMPNTLGNILGEATFKQDIRFAPFVRAYVFEDNLKRPVAAIWCHLDKLDDGWTDSPVVRADFKDSLEGVFDLMNSPRSFTTGNYQFPISNFPIFLRGKPGTLNIMTEALAKALIISGEGVSPLAVSAKPSSPDQVRVEFKNYLSMPFNGSIAGVDFQVPPSGTAAIQLPAPEAIAEQRITPAPLKHTITSDAGAKYITDLSYEALRAKRVPENLRFNTMDWNLLPAIPFTRNIHKKETTGTFGVGWNASGLFIQVQVKDPTFVHLEYPKTGERWLNDCLQIYIDTMANARSRTSQTYDEDDYDYALFPNAKGDSAIVYRYRSVEQQLGLATAAPPDNTVAHDIPCSFTNQKGILTYRVCFPAKYLLPAKLEKGWAMGFGLFADNSDTPKKVTSALTLATDGGGCFNRPKYWPVLLLWD